MTTETQTPEDWVLLEAAKRCNFPPDIATNSEVLRRTFVAQAKSFHALCDMIAKHEKPPVDPLVEALLETFPRANGAVEMAKDLRRALADRGYGIVEVSSAKSFAS
jgi:hypothetical protein